MSITIQTSGACIEIDTKSAASLTSEANQTIASIRDAEPSAYGFFAALPSLLRR